MYNVIAYSIKSRVFGVVAAATSLSAATEAAARHHNRHWKDAGAFLQYGVEKDGAIVADAHRKPIKPIKPIRLPWA